MQMIEIAGLGMLQTALMLRTKNLLYPMIMHGLLDFSGILRNMAEPHGIPYYVAAIVFASYGVSADYTFKGFVMAVVLTLLVAFFEEYLWRGIILSVVKQYVKSELVLVVGLGALFGLWHITNAFSQQTNFHLAARYTMLAFIVVEAALAGLTLLLNKLLTQVQVPFDRHMTVPQSSYLLFPGFLFLMMTLGTSRKECWDNRDTS
ncbi:CPBP family intramembrane metalloprotease [Weissella confusa]|uniref:CPBP family intramembrane metalloprotease n=1 Tax=Weissella confusa TaxID=1583 RepID=A0A923NFR8_WEICO|nr:CPBP family intramembrane metalloprotease [Weissella confusa]